MYTLFLHPKGKVLSDAFVFQPRIYKQGKPKYADEELWLDIDRSVKSVLKQHLRKHLWRKKANLIDV
jgi:folate-binding Fe-S cluster repair protein YgfZ